MRKFSKLNFIRGYTEPTLWPQNRDLKMFLERFDVEFLSGVYDLLDDPIET